MKLEKGICLMATMFCMYSVMAQTGTLTKKEITDGWALLFDGKSLDGWQ